MTSINKTSFIYSPNSEQLENKYPYLQSGAFIFNCSDMYVFYIVSIQFDLFSTDITATIMDSNNVVLITNVPVCAYINIMFTNNFDNYYLVWVPERNIFDFGTDYDLSVYAPPNIT